MAKKPQDEYSKKEAAERLVAALRGARAVGHKPMSDMVKKPKDRRLRTDKLKRR